MCEAEAQAQAQCVFYSNQSISHGLSERRKIKNSN
jgi:hypothetical protein